MTNYQSEFSHTAGTIALTAMLATHALSGANAHGLMEQNHRATSFRTYTSGASPRTYDQYANVVTGEYNISSGLVGLEQTVSQLYAHLVANQEPLGSEFEAALNENLWDLYES